MIKYQNNLLKNIQLEKKRFLYNKLNSKEKLVWIVWLRGTGKTTILLQKLKENKNIDKSIYFSMDNPKVISRWLFDLITDLYFNYWFRYFYVDEIHKYNKSNQELKNIYDSFGDINLLFSGSSSVDIIKWTYDLSRRVLLLKLPILSFREYLNFKYNLDLKVSSFEDILNKWQKISFDLLDKNIWIIKEFKKYLDIWELPFFMSTNKDDYKFKIENIINKIIYEDISNFYQLKTQNLHIFKEIIYFIINSNPWLFSYSSLWKFLNISSDTLKIYINILSEIWLIKIISYSGNISQELRKAKKIYFCLSNINYVDNYIDMKNIGRIRESFFVYNISYILKWWFLNNEKISYISDGDFQVNLGHRNYIFEIWWKNKTRKQVWKGKDIFIVKDDIIDCLDNIIPLWLFGFLY